MTHTRAYTKHTHVGLIPLINIHTEIRHTANTQGQHRHAQTTHSQSTRRSRRSTQCGRQCPAYSPSSTRISAPDTAANAACPGVITVSWDTVAPGNSDCCTTNVLYASLNTVSATPPATAHRSDDATGVDVPPGHCDADGHTLHVSLDDEPVTFDTRPDGHATHDDDPSCG